MDTWRQLFGYLEKFLRRHRCSRAEVRGKMPMKDDTVKNHLLASAKSLEEGHVESLRKAEGHFTLGVFALAIFLAYAGFYYAENRHNFSGQDIPLYVSVAYLLGITLTLLAIYERRLRVKWHLLQIQGIRMAIYCAGTSEGIVYATHDLMHDPGNKIKDALKKNCKNIEVDLVENKLELTRWAIFVIPILVILVAVHQLTYEY